MFNKSFDAIIVMQIVICHSHGWQQSVLLVTDQPGPRHIAHVVVSTSPRELTEILPDAAQPRSRHTVHIVICYSHGCQQSVLLRPRSAQIKAYSACRRLHRPKGAHRDPSPTRNATAQPGSSWPRRREAFLPLARSYRMKGMPRASLHCRGRRGRYCCGNYDGGTARRGQRAELTLVSRAMRCHPEE
jgi:hypothetical protein